MRDPVDTSAEAVERLAAECADLAQWARRGEYHAEAARYRKCAATLRALAAERDRLREALAAAQKGAQHD